MGSKRWSAAETRATSRRSLPRGLFCLFLALAVLITARATLRAQEPAPGDAFLFLTEVFPIQQEPQIGAGDWLEVANAGEEAVNLRGWNLRSDHGLTLTVASDVWIEAGAYAVIAQRAEPEDMTGVPVLYADRALVLGPAETLELWAPGGRRVDSFAWGASPAVEVGRSLERTALHEGAAWQIAWKQWPRGGGAYGTPGGPWDPPPTPTPPPILVISEYLADPSAVADDVGEWVELHNPNQSGVDLAGWSLGDALGERIALDGLAIAAHTYLVIGRNADPGVNGGVQVSASLGSVHLANASDTLELRAPDGTLVDWAAWGAGSGIAEGRSQERMAEGTSRDQEWRTAVSPWPGSAGDWGSPGQPPPEAPPTPTPAPTPVPPPAIPDAWSLPRAPLPLQLDEVSWRGDEEYVVLVNRSAEAVSLAGWMLSDAQSPQADEGLYFLPADRTVPAGGGFVVARSGDAFARRWLALPDAQFESSLPEVPVLAAHPEMAARFNLEDGGDEVVLLAPDYAIADALAYGDHQGATLGVEGTVTAGEGDSLQRVGDLPWPTVRDVRQRFVVAAQEPLLPLVLPPAANREQDPLGDGLVAQWGIAGTPTTFTQAESLSPLALLSLAAARGLHFVAPGDSQPLPPLPVTPPATLLPSWSWSDGSDHALLFGAPMTGLDDRRGLVEWLYTSRTGAIWLESGAPPSSDFLGGWAGAWPPQDRAAAPQRLLDLWRTSGVPWLPALGGRLALAGDGAQPILGLAATSADAGALLDALRARRGWLTTTPGLWLALAAATPSGRTWMGGEIDPANEVVVTIFAGDRSGRPLTVSLWQDGAPVATWETAGASARDVTLLARPGAFLYATARGEGDLFAATAPLHVRPSADLTVLLNEILADPEGDLDGDGQPGESDEFIELWNPGAQPVALAGWQLFDSRSVREGGRRFTFGDTAVIPAGGLLTVWRRESGIVLNNRADRVYLFLPGGGEADEAGWDEWPQPGLAFARGEAGWQHGQPPTPGLPNAAQAAGAVAATPETATFASPAMAAPVPVAPESAPVAQPDHLPLEASTADDPSPVSSAGAAPLEAAAAPAPTIAYTRRIGLAETTWVQGVVVVPPGLVNGSIYLADVGSAGRAGAGLRVYLPLGDYPPLAEGDLVGVTGVLHSFRGEKELRPSGPGAVTLLGRGAALTPQPMTISEVGEAWEARLVAVQGVVRFVDGDSLYLGDPAAEGSPPLRVVVLRSLGWPRPAATPGEVWRATGVVTQLARESPWNGGYRLIVRYPGDLVRLCEVGCQP